MKIKIISDLKFKVPSFEEEKKEFDRYGFSPEELETLKSQFKKENLKPLKSNIWKILQNTDSWNISSLEDAKKISSEYNKDWENILKAVQEKTTLPAPIVLERNGTYELVAGNTRLMVLKAVNKLPYVLIVKL